MNSKNSPLSKLFSVIIACYNCQDYLDETINSLLNQTIPFEDYIQVILVNDGSHDNTEEICLGYCRQYPENIIYMHQENQGQAVARNNGLEYATGDYVNFLDSDDKFSSNAFEEVLDFFKHHKDVNFVSIPMFFFDGEDGEHPLNYKYGKTRVVDLNKDWDYPQLHANSSFFKAELFPKYQFATNIVSSEDALMINRMLIDNPSYGVIKNAKYWYRRRKNNSSTLNSVYLKKEFYHGRLVNYFKELLNTSKEKHSEIPKFIQYLTVYDLQWMFRINDVSEILETDEIEQVYADIKDILSELDDNIILSLRDDRLNIRNHMLAIKYSNVNVDLNKVVTCQDFHSLYTEGTALMYSGDKLIDQLEIHKIWLDIIEIRKNTLYISGYLMSFFSDEDIRIEVIKTGNGKKETYTAKRVYYQNTAKTFMNCSIEDRYNFDVEIPIENSCSVEIITRFLGKDSSDGSCWSLANDFSYYARLSTLSNYSISDNHFLKFQDNKFFVSKHSYLKMIKNEIPILLRVIKRREDYWNSILLIRFLYTLLYPFYKNKRIWLFMDKIESADDNAEHLYKYSIAQDDGINKYFTVDEKSPDFKRLKKLKNILPFNSIKQRLIYLFAEKIISSHPDDEILNPFINKNEKSYSGLISSDKIFLQHGVTKDNVSSWLHKYEKNLKLIVAVSDGEAKSFLDEGYNYKKEIIQVLGFPRFDNLENGKTNKQILIMPSWRKKLLYAPPQYIMDSEYFKAINSLINNKNLIEIAKKYDYQIIFKPHPRVYDYIELFDTNEYIKIDENHTYQELFKSSDLMITDYSSVAFDFAYMKKPMIYYQYGNDYNFDEGYFKYKTMGFGEVISTQEELVDIIEGYLKNDCKMKDEYKSRVDNFYKYKDKNNCERVYSAILKL